MGFHHALQEATRDHQARLAQHPFIHAALAGDLSRDSYLAFLEQAYHHVKHTASIFMAAGARLPQRASTVRRALAEYIEEEIGHDAWILADITACGGDAEAVRQGRPDFGCEMMVAFIYDQVNRLEPMAAFGMVQVLEGTSIQVASQCAEALMPRLELGPDAFQYLLSHGALDLEHYRFFTELMDTVTDPAQQQAIIHSAKRCYELYIRMFDDLPLTVDAPQAAPAVAR